MHTKKNATFLLNVVISMLILAYITFVTVYEQILTQNNGFFNVIIYGVVLILVFIFITLFVRILTFRNNADVSPILSVLKVIGVIGLFALFVFLRLRYTSSVSPNESPLYNTARYIINGQLDQAKNIHSHIIAYPADFVYAYFLSNIFSIAGLNEGVYIAVNISMLIITALFVFLSVRLISTEACSVLALLIMLFMPNNGYLVYSYNSELFVAAAFSVSLYLYLLLIYKRFKKPQIARVIALLCGVLAGIAISSEPVILLGFITLTFWVFSAKRQSVFSTVIPLVISLIEVIISLILKSLMIGVSFFDTLKGFFLCFVPSVIRVNEAEFSFSSMFSALTQRLNNPNKFLDDNSYFLSNVNGGVVSSDQALWLNVLDQFIYLFVLILCVLCIVYIIRVSYDKILPLYSVMIVLFLGQLLGGINEVNYLYFIIVLIIIGSTTSYYMYFNHHPNVALLLTNEAIRQENMLVEEAESSDENADEPEDNDILIRRARALIFIGEDEELYKQIKLEERANRANSKVAATIIKTGINEEGEYNFESQDIEYFDEPDEQIKVKPVHEVIAIPATRPVEVVKPILADDYENEEGEAETTNINSSTQANINEESKVSSDAKPTDVIEKAPVQPEGFIFRKKEGKPVENEEPKGKQKKARNIEKEPKVKYKNDKKRKSLDEIKPGEPLPNPLKGPAPSNKKQVDFDFDVTDKDDFDF